MGYGDGVRIERAENGYTVTMRDPAIVEANAKRDLNTKGSYKPYVDPERSYVFTDIKDVMTFLTANLDKALPKVDYDSAFEAMSEDDGED